ncbi:MAG: 3'-5' exonuclease [Nanobdellota archaeon]
MVTIHFYLTDVQYRESQITLFGKTVDGKSVSIFDEFHPYILVQDEVPAMEGIRATGKTSRIYRGEEEEFIKIYYDRPIKKQLENLGIRVYEDIPPARRYMIDNDLTPLTFYELEVQASTRKVKGDALRLQEIKGPLDGSMELNAAGIHFLTEKGGAISYVSIIGPFGTKIFAWRHFQSDMKIEFVSSEADLIERLKAFLDRVRPDVLVGFRISIAFAYLVQRARKYRIRLELGTDYSEVSVFRGRARIHGLPLVNISRLAKLAGEPLDSLSPDTDDPLSLAMSTLKNSKQALEFFNRQPLFEELARLVGTTEVSNMGSAQMLEWHLVRMSPQHKQLIPDQQPHTEKEFVRTKVGQFTGISEFSFKNLLPSIAIAHNVSLETLDCRCCKTPFCKKKRGFISLVLDNLVARQQRIEQILKNKESANLQAREIALRTLINGFKYNRRWYSESCWKAMRDILTQMIDSLEELAQRHGVSIIRSDEGSFFAQNVTDQFTEALSNLFADRLEIEFRQGHKIGLFLEEAYILPTRTKGFTPKILFAKRVLKEVISRLFEGRNQEAAHYLCNQLDAMPNAPLEEFIVRTELKKALSEYTQDFYHVRAARQMQEKGYFIVPGMIIQYVVTPYRKVMLPEDAQAIDQEYYTQYLFKFLQPILDFYGIQEQESLKKYMK